jgi:hypothetical protein
MQLGLSGDTAGKSHDWRVKIMFHLSQEYKIPTTTIYVILFIFS